jgi:hypothetical protein
VGSWAPFSSQQLPAQVGVNGIWHLASGIGAECCLLAAGPGRADVHAWLEIPASTTDALPGPQCLGQVTSLGYEVQVAVHRVTAGLSGARSAGLSGDQLARCWP